MNILLVDDEPYELEQLDMFVRKLCPLWKIYQAIDGRQALAVARDVKLHLAFLDIRLPGKSGIVVGEELRVLHPNMDMIILTAYQDFQYARQALRIGAMDYLTKPIIASEIEAILVKYRDKDEHLIYSDVVLKALTIMHERFAEKLGLGYIADLIYVNPSYLSRKFSEEIGVSVSEHLLTFRIEQAKSMIAHHRNWSISQVAEACGFSSQHYFSTSFKKEVGITPREYRELEGSLQWTSKPQL